MKLRSMGFLYDMHMVATGCPLHALISSLCFRRSLQGVYSSRAMACLAYGDIRCV